MPGIGTILAGAPNDSGIDDNSVGVFEGDCNFGDIANVFMF